jgi:dipeptidyl aminopeptidase/acylaminoacyl peptidase
MPNARFVAWAAALSLLVAPAASAQRDLTPLDVVTMRSVSGVYPSPNGIRVAFTRTEPRTPAGEPGSAYGGLYLLVDAEGERPLAAGNRNVGGVSWMPDGSAITFLERRNGAPARQLYALTLDAGDPEQVFVAERGIIQYRWRPDGKAVAFTARESVPEHRAAARQLGFRPSIVDEDWTPIGLYLWTEETDSVRRLALEGSVFGLEWSSDGSRLALAVAPRPLTDDGYMFKRIHVMDVGTGAVRQVVDNPGKLGGFTWSPDSRRIAYVSAVDARDPHAGMLFVADAASGNVTSLTPDFEGMVHSAEWLSNQHLRLRVSRGVESVVTDLDVGRGSFRDLPAGPGAFQQVHTVGSTVAAVVSSPDHPSEVYTYSDGSWTRRTNTNPWLGEVMLSRQVVHRFTASDGVEIEGILLFPLNFEEGSAHPLVVVAHGGPESHYTNGWMTSYSGWGQLLSRGGYFVWYPNYRSSTGRGVAFAKDDHGDLMGREFQDHLDAIDHFVARGWVDRDRVGVGGGSYGGYTAAWAATRHTDHFAAAVSFVPIAHVATKWLTTDIPWEYYYVHYEEQWPHEQWDYLEERSPLTYAPQSRTPLLLLGGTNDSRVHPSQPFMLYRAVEATTDTPVRYVRYPGEGHGNATNVYRYDYAVRSLRWFDHYLRSGAQRSDPPPPPDLDYAGWVVGR